MKKCPKCELNYINDEDELCDVCKGEILGSQNTKQGRKTFAAMGLSKGQQIEFIFHSEVKATIYSNDTVWFESKEWHLTPLMEHLSKRFKLGLTLGSGFEAFRYDEQDVNLYKRWERLNLPKKN